MKSLVERFFACVGLAHIRELVRGLRSSDRVVAWLDRLIIVLVALLLVAGAYRLWWVRPKMLPPLPAAFPLPTILSQPQVQPRTAAGPARPVPPMQRAAAETAMRHGATAYQAGNLVGALAFFQQAKALLPRDPRPALHVAKVERKMVAEKLWREIQTNVQRGDLNLACSGFASATRHDLSFFLDYTPTMVGLLEGKAEIASAVSLLRTYCHFRPQANSENKKLAELGKSFAK